MKSTKQSRQTFMLKRKILPAVISALLASGYAQAQQEPKKAADEKASTELDTTIA